MNKSTYPIRVVADRTGLKADLIRMWERRYQAVQPGRTPSGHRLYSDQDIFRLSLLREALDCGWRIGDISARGNEELTDLIAGHEQTRRKGVAFVRKIGLVKEEGAGHMNGCLKAVNDLDLTMLSSLLESAENEMGIPEVLDHLVSPLLIEIGRRWENGEVTLGQEHMISATVRRYLDSVRVRETPFERASTILSTTPSGQNHELGALMTAATAAASGWNSIYMNPNTPATDIAWTANKIEAKVVALSIVYPARDALLISELLHLVKLLSSDTYLVLGGASTDFLRPVKRDNANCISITSQKEVQRFLTEVQARVESGTGNY